MRKKFISLSIMLVVIWLLPTGVFADSANNDNNDNSEQAENAEESGDGNEDDSSNEENSEDNSTDEDSESDSQNDDSDSDSDDESNEEESNNDSNDGSENDEGNDSEEDKDSGNDSVPEVKDSDADEQNDDSAESKSDDETDNEDKGEENDSENNSDDDETKSDDKDDEDNEDSHRGDLSISDSAEVDKSSTSKLGHLSKGAEIYESLEEDSSKLDSGDYINAVYYIKEQAEVENEGTFYLISTKPSSEKGVVGWVKASDMTTHKHSREDKKEKTFYLTGKGTSYDKAWGGSKDAVFDMSDYEGELFEVHKTVTVGGNTWYRGEFKGETVWLHESYVTELETSKMSKLGHIKSGTEKIYETLGDESSVLEADDYKNAVYYIKKKGKVNEDTYYLISNKPSSSKGTIGWVKASNMSTNKHERKDTYSKSFYFTGEGNAYSKAWGGSEDKEYDLSEYRNEEFDINKTEKVGNNTWYRGKVDGKTVWAHSSYVTSNKPEKTSRLGHFKNSKVKIYDTLNNLSEYEKAGSDFTNAVYYIKSESTVEGNKYYLLSTKPSSKKDVVGWVEASDMTTHKHSRKDTKDKKLYMTGKGSAYDKAWGGSENVVFGDMSDYNGELFNVHKTETVGDNTWYRGDFRDEQVWLHESYVTDMETDDTSRLGHIKGIAEEIYDEPGDESSSHDVEDYKNKVYYIKEKAEAGDQTYYHISEKPSSEKGVVGWMKKEDMSTHKHLRKDSKEKTFYMTGEGTAYGKAWGGSEDAIFEDMSEYEDETFKVHKTETVGSNTWYRGKFKDETVWLHSSYVDADSVNNTGYDISFEDALDQQMGMDIKPQTDRYADDAAFVKDSQLVTTSQDHIDADDVYLRSEPKLEEEYEEEIVDKGTEVAFIEDVSGESVDGSDLWYKIKYNDEELYVHSSLMKSDNAAKKDINVHQNEDTGSHVFGTVQKGAHVDIDTKGDSWSEINYEAWRNAQEDDVEEYLNPEHFIDSDEQKFQFLDLSKTTDPHENKLNDYLDGKGEFDSEGSAFIDAGNEHAIDYVYLVAHAMHETGNGTSELSQGVKHEGETVYNMYGIGAIDEDPINEGAKRAYEEGWDTPEKAIIGGAKYVAEDYVAQGQDTLYKMRWNPAAMEKGNPDHQYATDIGWAEKQVDSIYELYEELDIDNQALDIPHYK